MPASSDELSTSVIRMLRMLHATRARAPRVHPSVEPSHHSVLVAVREHPSRVGDIAERNLTDASTVSRQVSHLTGLGLLAKVPDPADGRAQLVALTDEGAALLDELVARREAWFADLLGDWSEGDISAFIAYVDRFCDAVAADERHRP
ncbi:MarR family winged helix-turn-helix transcriptional regulator [Janibacter hoylei]|uniref:MarR family transcriptional regulator n=2 Tax=Janibacter TaxID=53457 RepID=K1EAM7_9MICO|nr:MarR family transcriptional regulator [Janibacter hoylei]EKA62492.1 MarR family transcriptional regulator [Janibacter hoylei PVAS-1]MCW4601418.1 MarR family transcriptional regulator [Janibacter hoylei]RWU83027.1 MarR family transcriptional regulator [Janibacter hoylei PVAS-1]